MVHISENAGTTNDMQILWSAIKGLCEKQKFPIQLSKT